MKTWVNRLIDGGLILGAAAYVGYHYLVPERFHFRSRLGTTVILDLWTTNQAEVKELRRRPAEPEDWYVAEFVRYVSRPQGVQELPNGMLLRDQGVRDGWRRLHYEGPKSNSASEPWRR